MFEIVCDEFDLFLPIYILIYHCTYVYIRNVCAGDSSLGFTYSY